MHQQKKYTVMRKSGYFFGVLFRCQPKDGYQQVAGGVASLLWLMRLPQTAVDWLRKEGVGSVRSIGVYLGPGPRAFLFYTMWHKILVYLRIMFYFEFIYGRSFKFGGGSDETNCPHKIEGNYLNFAVESLNTIRSGELRVSWSAVWGFSKVCDNRCQWHFY